MKKPAVTIKDVSARCGLSVSTVSKALNGYDDISRETRELVLRTSREIGYFPNAIARALKTNRSYNLGVLFQEQSGLGLCHPFFSAVLNALKAESEAQGYDLTFINHNIGGRDMTYLAHCRHRNVDGVYIVCGNFGEQEMQELIHSDLPCVTVDFQQPGHTCVLNENRLGMRSLTRHAIELAHTRIAMVHGEPCLATSERIAGFQEAMAEAGLPVPEGYIVPDCYIKPTSGYEAIRQLMALPQPPTCVLMQDDYSALGAMNALKELGLRVPEDVSIGGYDGVPTLQMLKPRLTTVSQNAHDVGLEAAQLLIELIENPKAKPGRVANVPTALLVGESMARKA